MFGLPDMYMASDICWEIIVLFGDHWGEVPFMIEGVPLLD